LVDPGVEGRIAMAERNTIKLPSGEMAASFSVLGKSVTRSMWALASGFSQTSSDR